MYDYAAKILRWIDADTLDISIDLGFDVWLGQRVRIAGINAPELHGPERVKGIEATAFAIALAMPGDVVHVRTVKTQEKYGRYLASILTAHGKDIATELIAAGLAKPWDGQGPKP